MRIENFGGLMSGIRICVCLSDRVVYWLTAKEYICMDCQTLYPLSMTEMQEARERYKKLVESEPKSIGIVFRPTNIQK
jgi:hypothetical protein